MKKKREREMRENEFLFYSFFDFVQYCPKTIVELWQQQDKTNLSRDGLNPAHVPCWQVNKLTLVPGCKHRIGRADIEESKSGIALNAPPPQASYPCGNFSDTSSRKQRLNSRKGTQIKRAARNTDCLIEEPNKTVTKSVSFSIQKWVSANHPCQRLGTHTTFAAV